jgi:hypothetical protein|tara:strand:- start:2033 stop:2620 length:588 start_codon:yes stop_codon:yes gene_type:complete
MIKKHVHTTKSNQSITVVDGLFNTAEIVGIHTGLLQLPYQIGQSNSAQVQNLADKRMITKLSPPHLERFALFDHEQRQPTMRQLIPEEWEISDAYVNLGLKSDTQSIHVDAYDRGGDNQYVTYLYYANDTWQSHWGGETLFFDDASDEVEYVVRPRPGRVVVFDSQIPHLAHIQTTSGPSYRFTIAIKFQKPGAL